MSAYVRCLRRRSSLSCGQDEVPFETLGARMPVQTVGARTAISLPLRNNKALTAAWLGKIKKDLIERECQAAGVVESPFTLDNVAGHDAVKEWLGRTRHVKPGRCARGPWAIHCRPHGTGKTSSSVRAVSRHPVSC